MRTFVGALLLLAAAAYTAVAFENPDTGECDKDWEPRDVKDEAIRLAAEYAAHLYSKDIKQEFQDILVEVVKGYIKPCRYPRYNFTAIYGISDCKVDDIDRLDCALVEEKGLHKCKSYMWVPPGYGSKLETHVCENV